jgi:hypothetical protein
MSRCIDRTGIRHGRLIPLYMVPDVRPVQWHCRCDCGTEKNISAADISGPDGTKSCGCINRERSTKHGMAGHPLYVRWQGMLARCRNPKHIGYANYGGRGIQVCERWYDFANFLADMGEPPDRGMIERIDNSGPYSPENCRWATPIENASNTRRNHFVTFQGETHTVKEWSRKLGLQQQTLDARLGRLGWPIERALTSVKKGTGKYTKRVHASD